MRRAFDGVRATWAHGTCSSRCVLSRAGRTTRGNTQRRGDGGAVTLGCLFHSATTARRRCLLATISTTSGFTTGELHSPSNRRVSCDIQRARMSLARATGAIGISKRRGNGDRSARLTSGHGRCRLTSVTTLSSWAFTPRVGVKADVISGDRNPHDGTLGTFNPLFPKLTYFSDANVITPANLFDVQPTLGLTLRQGLRVTAGWNVLWRYSREDAFYLPPLKPVIPFTLSGGRYIGQQWASTIEWRMRSRVTVAAAWVAFRPGSALRREGGVSGQFLFASVQRDF